MVQKVAQKVATEVFGLKGISFKLAQKVIKIRQLFKRKFVTKNF